ncbi:MAG: DUF2628 domain-containing protein [Clostridia bacterium]|nr:DUF2628 domain-containing protein [Clostridia bacterium]
MLHANDVCPVCGQVFSENDDVVYCPDCGAPHHRACWQQNGGCAHAAAHESGFVWRSVSDSGNAHNDADADPEQDSIRCPRCGEELSADTLVCPECGQRLGEVPVGGRFDFNADFFMRGVEGEPDEDLDGMTVREAAMFTQYRAGAYVRKFRKLQNKKVGWNWAAFLFSPFWFFYRKHYKAGALFMGIMLVIAVFMAIPMSNVRESLTQTVTQYVEIDEQTTPDQIMQAIVALNENQKQQIQSAVLRYSKWMLLYFGALFLPNIAAGMTADLSYKKKIVRDVQSMRDFAKNEQTFRMLILRRGGVSILGVMASYLAAEMILQGIFYYL